MQTNKTYTRRYSGRSLALSRYEHAWPRVQNFPKVRAPMTSLPINRVLFVLVAVILAVAHLPAHAGVIIYVDSSATA